MNEIVGLNPEVVARPRAADVDAGKKRHRVIIRKAEVQRRTGKGSTQLWRAVRDDSFPQPVEIGSNSIGWYEDEIDTWVDTRPRRGVPDPGLEGRGDEEPEVVERPEARLPANP